MPVHFHIYQDCPVIQSYCLEIVKELKLILGVENDYSFGTIYLYRYIGNIPTEFNAKDKYLLKVLLIASKKAINKKWLDKIH